MSQCCTLRSSVVECSVQHMEREAEKLLEAGVSLLSHKAAGLGSGVHQSPTSEDMESHMLSLKVGPPQPTCRVLLYRWLKFGQRMLVDTSARAHACMDRRYTAHSLTHALTHARTHARTHSPLCPAHLRACARVRE